MATVEPSAFKTSILNNSTSAFTQIEDYNVLRGKIAKFTSDLVERAEDPVMVVRKVAEVVQVKNPKFRNIIGKVHLP